MTFLAVDTRIEHLVSKSSVPMGLILVNDNHARQKRQRTRAEDDAAQEWNS
jgi:hypothetical protein